MRLLSLSILGLVALAGCTSIDTEQFKSKNQDCVRQCTGVYSSCMSGAMGLIAQSGCSSGFKGCANSCPDRK
jgi:hypothetical protein